MIYLTLGESTGARATLYRLLRATMSVTSTVMSGDTTLKYTRSGVSQGGKSEPCTQLLSRLIQCAQDLGDLPYLPECHSRNGRTPVVIAAATGNAAAVHQLASCGYSVDKVRRSVAR